MNQQRSQAVEQGKRKIELILRSVISELASGGTRIYVSPQPFKG